MTGDPVPCTTEQNQLGEGERWDARWGELLRVDILAGRVYRDRVDDADGLIPIKRYDLPGTVARSGPTFDAAGVAERVTIAGQSFFDPLPSGADLYVVRKERRAELTQAWL